MHLYSLFFLCEGSLCRRLLILTNKSVAFETVSKRISRVLIVSKRISSAFNFPNESVAIWNCFQNNQSRVGALNVHIRYKSKLCNQKLMPVYFLYTSLIHWLYLCSYSQSHLTACCQKPVLCTIITCTCTQLNWWLSPRVGFSLTNHTNELCARTFVFNVRFSLFNYSFTHTWAWFVILRLFSAFGFWTMFSTRKQEID